ncbi:L-rhamnose-binding lectin CSL3-like [Hydractinia symbiolongicarpus]|uniref:L-rhamnose-binding lectin CSL3-like n=1 Tax=Hydractinia symbiolongicarpus TaxID=13093 RepID=UPI00254D28D7|nr:L-rhamnose-binding lectin CSL3-like [Hydractinia symbiolongicarpus]
MLSITACDEEIKRGTVCEHRTLSLKCPLETVIEVSSANYGRLSKHICHSATSHRTTTCRASSSLNKVRSSCNGKQSCKISASNRVFGDPCVGIFKYLEVNFICRRIRPQDIACEHKTFNAQCPRGTMIRITYANYGRLSKNICPGGNSHSTTTCRARSSLAKVSAACNGKRSCSIGASNRVFGDPCHGVYKYLSVHHSCLKIHEGEACEHKRVSLRCPAGLKIKVTYAMYGRLSKFKCPSSTSHRTTTCRASSSLRKVAHACNGKRSCSIAASNGIFGDPCWGIFKYLSVQHICV